MKFKITEVHMVKSEFNLIWAAKAEGKWKVQGWAYAPVLSFKINSLVIKQPIY